jgi:hypothetical protein
MEPASVLVRLTGGRTWRRSAPLAPSPRPEPGSMGPQDGRRGPPLLVGEKLAPSRRRQLTSSAIDH